MTKSDYPSIFNKLFRPGHTGKPVPFWTDAGIDLRGNEAWLDPTYSGASENRRLSLIIAEGVAACLQGLVAKCARPVGTVVSAEVSERFYNSYDPLKYGSGPNILVIKEEDVEVTVYSTRRSTSASAKPNQAKTEPGIISVVLLSALWKFIHGDDTPHFVLNRYQELLSAMDAAGSKTQGGIQGLFDSIIPSAMQDEVKNRLLRTCDAIYQYMAYGRSQADIKGKTALRTWTLIRSDTHNNPVGWTAGAADITPILSNYQLFRRVIVDRTWPTSTPLRHSIGVIPDLRGKDLVKISAYISTQEGGPLPVIFQGPPGGGKTTAVRHADDGMPLIRMTITRDMPMYLVVGSYERDGNNFVPKLGKLAATVRFAMLRSLIISLKRGSPIPLTLERYSGSGRITDTLGKLAERPTDVNLIHSLDDMAWPYYPEWKVVEKAYFEAKAHNVGPVIRFFLDEVYDCLGNRKLITILKTMLSDERRVVMGQAGAGWSDMYAYNVHFVGAGNPATAIGAGDFLDQALRSRFAFMVSVGYPSESTELQWVLSAKESFEPAQPENLSLADATYEPPEAPNIRISDDVARAAVAYARWSRTAVMSGMQSTAPVNQQCLTSALDPRVAKQIATATQYLVDQGISLNEAFTKVVDAMIDRFVPANEEGLPLDQQRIAAVQKAEALIRQQGSDDF